MSVVGLPASLDANLWKLKFDPKGAPVPTKRWVFVDNEKIMYWKSETKPKNVGKIAPKKVFKLKNCALSTNIIPPLKVPRPMMFQVFDKVENDSMIFAANTPDEFDLWIAFLKVYCILRPPLLGMEANLWKIKFTSDGLGTPIINRRWVYADDEKIMYWREHQGKHDNSKPHHMSESVSKKVFLLQHCVVSTNVPPMKPPRSNMFQVSDLVNDEHMVFGADDDEQFTAWMKFLRKYCRYGKAPLPREVEPEPDVAEELPLVAIGDIITDFFFQHALHVLPDPENPQISQESLSELLRIIAPHVSNSAVQLILLCLLKDIKNDNESISYAEFSAWWGEYTHLIATDPDGHDAPLSPTTTASKTAGTFSVVDDGKVVPTTKVDLVFQTDAKAVTLAKLFPLRSRDRPLEGGFMSIWDTHQRATQFVSPYGLVGVKQPVLPAVQKKWNIVCNLPSFECVGTQGSGEEVHWNAIYQTLVDRAHEPPDAIPIGQTEEETVSSVSLLRNFDLAALKGKFHVCALQGVTTIIDELSLPNSQKLIPPVGGNPNEEPNYALEEEQAHVDEAHSHDTYLHNGLVFRVVSAETQMPSEGGANPLSADFVKQQALTIGDDILHKIAGQEFRSAHYLQSATAAIRYHDMVKSTGKALTSAIPWLLNPGLTQNALSSGPPAAAKSELVSVDPESVLQHTAKSHAWFERKQKEATRSVAGAASSSLPCPSLMLSTLVDYCGFRVEVVAPVDLSQSSLAYGFNLKTADRGSSFVSTVKNMNPWISEVGSLMGIQPCSVGQLRGVLPNSDSGKAHKLDSALFLSKSMHMHQCPFDKRIYCTSMHDLLPNDFPRSGTADVLTRFLRPEFCASAGAEADGLAAGSFRHYEDAPQWDFSSPFSSSKATSSRFQTAVTKCKEVYTKRLPGLAAQLDKLEYIPVDSYQLTKLLHMHGCNCRALGTLFGLVSSPHCKYLIMCEIVARASKAVLNNALRMMARQKVKPAAGLADQIQSKSVVDTYVNFFNLVLGRSDAGFKVWSGVLADAVHKHFDFTLHFEDNTASFIHIPQLFAAMQYHCGITFTGDSFTNLVKSVEARGVAGSLSVSDVEVITPTVKVSISSDCPDAVGLIQRVAALADAYALIGLYTEALNAYRIRLSLLHLAYPAENAPFVGEVQSFPGDNNVNTRGGVDVDKTQSNELRCPKLQAIFDEVSYKIIHCHYQLGDFQAVVAACKTELVEHRVLKGNTHTAFLRKHKLSATVVSDEQKEVVAAGLTFSHSVHCVRVLSLLMCAEYRLQNVRKSTVMYEVACAICTDLLGAGHPLHAVLASTLSDLYKGSGAMQQSLIMKLHAQRVLLHATGSKSLVLASVACDVGDMYQLAHADSVDSEQHAVAAYSAALAVHTECLTRYKVKGKSGPDEYNCSSEDCKMHMLAVAKCCYKLAMISGCGRNEHQAAIEQALHALELIDSLLGAAEGSAAENCSLCDMRYELREAFNLRHLKVDCLSLIGSSYAALSEFPAAIAAFADAHCVVQTELRGQNFSGVVGFSAPPKLSRDFSVLIKNTLSAVLLSFSPTERKLLEDHVADVNKCRGALRMEFIDAYNCAVDFLIQFFWEIDNPALYFQVIMAKMMKYRCAKPSGCSIDLNGLVADTRFYDTTSTALLESCQPGAPSQDVSLRIFISCVLQSTVIVNLIR